MSIVGTQRVDGNCGSLSTKPRKPLNGFTCKTEMW
nr:MAG TPA: hypothetical protein [Bacteriophage sp.]